MKLLGWATTWLLVLLIGLSGCGIKSRPVPPQYAQPIAISDLRAQSTAHGIMLRWSRPLHFVGGGTIRNLAVFRIYRSSDRTPLALINALPVTDLQRFRQIHAFSYLDTTAAIGTPYRYEVVAGTTDGYESSPSNVVSVVRIRPTPTPNPLNYVLPTPSLPP
ncbi:MAG TPA: hypothetical protein VKV28_08345 [Candidatus Binataceae bacterium]|nr:hypothetical protein [Candidatus Binataceae bacterium]